MDKSIEDQEKEDIFVVYNERIKVLEKQTKSYMLQYDKMIGETINFRKRELELENLNNTIFKLERDLSIKELEIIEKNKEILKLQERLNKSGVNNLIELKT